jgi:hypothetical protein
MAYSTSLPPVKFSVGPLDDAISPGMWVYKSADAIATVKAANYFSNGYDLGLTVGDMVYVYDTATPAVSIGWVKTVTTGGAASLSGTVTTMASS